MARPRAFDESAALDVALACFWQRGYARTTMRQLATAMNLCSPSLYNAFGDKRTLFIRALERYLDRSMRARVERLEATLPPRQAIGAFFDEIIAASAADGGRRGCFLINSALDIAPHDVELGIEIAARLGEVEAFFHRAIVAAQADGAVAPGCVARDAARLLLGVLIGIRVLARSGPDRERLAGAARAALAALDTPAQSQLGTSIN
ncbi:MAG: TetR/AcrR family transcriptional regulator [Proteobacteria bacterium]|nr:TetR/AcrR family transcriptional regulator [Pseudomonadota bacterium]